MRSFSLNLSLFTAGERLAGDSSHRHFSACTSCILVFLSFVTLLSISPRGFAQENGEPVADDPRARRAWELEAFGDPSTYADRLLREQERQRVLYPSQVPRGRVGQPPMPLSPSGPVWVSLGPTNASFETNGITLNVVDSGRLRTILPHPTDANTVYILASGGGLWRTNNFLANPPTWVPLTDSLLTTGGGAATFGATPSVIYLGLGDPFDSSPLAGGAMTKSTDGGNNWSAPIKLNNSSSSVRDVKVDIQNGQPDVVLAATDVGLFRSADGGATYQAVADGNGQLFSGLGHWSLVQTSAGWLVSARSIANPPGNGALFIPTERGATWNPITNTGGVISNIGRVTLGVGVPGDNVVYAFAANTGDADQRDLFRSTNGGQDWTALNLPGKVPSNPNDDQPDMDVMHNQAFYNQMLLVDPTDAARNIVYIGGNLSSVKSADGGATWTVITNWLPGGNFGTSGLPYAHADFHAAALSNISGNRVLFFGNDGGLFVSTDNGATWNDKKNIGLVTHLHYSLTSSPTSPSSTITGLQDLGTRVREGNTSIFDQTLGGDGFGAGTGQTNAQVTLGSLYYGDIRRSDDLGVLPSHWVRASSGITVGQGNVTFTTLVATPGPVADPTGKVFFTTGFKNIYRTTDGATSWQSIGAQGSGGIGMTTIISSRPHVIGISALDTNHIGVGAAQGLFLVTSNGGASWTELGLFNQIPGWLRTANVAWASNTLLYVCSENNAPGVVRVIRSTDGGLTFSPAAGGLPDVQVHKLAVDPNDATGNTVYAATFIGVYRTTNGGANWSLFGAGLPTVHVTDMYIPPDGKFLRVSTFGRGIWEVPIKPIAATSTSLTSDVNPSAFGQNVTFTATVSTGTGTPAGDVSFLDGVTTLGTGALDANRTASFTTGGLSLGTHSITASYPGDSDHAGSVSTPALNQRVIFATSTALGASPNPSTFNQPVTITANVTSPSAPPPQAGTVMFFNGNQPLGSTAVDATGAAMLTTSALPAGTDMLAAVYGGDGGANYAASTAPSISQTVNGFTFNVTAGTSFNGTLLNIGKPVTFTAQVINMSGGSVDNVVAAPVFNANFFVNSISSDVGSCSAIAANCALGTMADGAQANLTVTLTPLFSAYDFTGTIQVNATVNNPAPTVIRVRPLPFHF